MDSADRISLRILQCIDYPDYLGRSHGITKVLIGGRQEGQPQRNDDKSRD